MRKYEINKCNKNNQGTEERDVVFYTEWLGKEAESVTSEQRYNEGQEGICYYLEEASQDERLVSATALKTEIRCSRNSKETLWYDMINEKETYDNK